MISVHPIKPQANQNPGIQRIDQAHRSTMGRRSTSQIKEADQEADQEARSNNNLAMNPNPGLPKRISPIKKPGTMPSF
jgi:hypothetical protein